MLMSAKCLTLVYNKSNAIAKEVTTNGNTIEQYPPAKI
jgi:hypothetical protein